MLILLYPVDRPETITSISLAVVFFNALSGSAAYARMKRIDYRSGLLFAAAAVPGAIFGAIATAYVPRRLFDGVFGVLLIIAAAALFWNTFSRPHASQGAHCGPLVRTVTEADGTRHTFGYDPAIGVLLSGVTGFVSSLLGTGGGFIHVPALVYLLGFPAHVATATSHFILAFMALAGTLVHVATGAFAHAARRTGALALGVLVGAQLGARLSTRVQGMVIIRALAAGLGFVGIRILVGAL